MKIISFIDERQHGLIEKILRHCGLWEGPIRSARQEPVRRRRPGTRLIRVPGARLAERPTQPTTWNWCPTPSFLSPNDSRVSRASRARLQLVLDPE
jgi:hypothetical protein